MVEFAKKAHRHVISNEKRPAPFAHNFQFTFFFCARVLRGGECVHGNDDEILHVHLSWPPPTFLPPFTIFMSNALSIPTKPPHPPSREFSVGTGKEGA